MADTPKTSSENNRDRKTFGSLYTEIQQGTILTPEEQDLLQKRALEKFGGISGLLKKRKELIGENTRRELDDLLAGAPNKDAILSKLDPLLPGKDKVVEVAKQAAGTIKGAAEQGAKTVGEMVPQAMVQGMETAGRELKEEAGKAGTQVVSAMGDIVSANGIDGLTGGIGKLSKAVDAVSGFVGNAIHQLGELLSGLMAMLGLDKLWKSFSKLLGGDTSEDTKPSDAKKKPEAGSVVPDTVRGASDKVADKMEKAKKQYWDMLVSKGWITDPAKQKSNFEKLWASKAEDIKKGLQNVSESVIEGKKWNLLTDIFEPGTIGPMKFLLELVTNGVIPSQAIFSVIGDITSKSIQIGFKTTESFIRNTPGETMSLIGAFASTDIDKLKPEEKSVLLASVHHNMAMMLSIAGKLSLAVGTLALMPLYWDQGSGITRMKTLGSGAIGDFEAAGKNLDEMLKMLGDTDPKSPSREAFERMRQVIRDVQLKSTTTALYLELKKAGKLDGEIAQEMRKILEGVEIGSHPLHGISPESQKDFKQMVEALTTGEGEEKLIKYLENKPKPSTQNILSKIFERTRSVAGWNPTEVRITDAIDQAENVGKSLSDTVKNKNSIFKMWSQLRLGMKFEEFVASIDRGVLPIIAQDTTQAKGIMERFMRAIPSGFDHFFSSLAVTLTIAHVSASDEKLKTLGEDILMMNPFFGGYILIKEGLEVQDNKLSKGGYLVAGGAVLAIGAVQLSKVISATGMARVTAVSELLLGPVHTFGRGILALSRGVSYTSLVAENALRPGAAKPFIHGRAFASYLMLAAIAGYFMYEKYSEENEKKVLAEKGILKPDGTMDMAKIKETFLSLPEDQRSSLLERLLNGSLVPYGIRTSITKGGNETVVHSDNPAKAVAPIPLDFFEMIASTMKEVGVGDGKTFLSKGATESTKQFIAQLPVSEDKKREFYGKFGIPV